MVDEHRAAEPLTPTLPSVPTVSTLTPTPTPPAVLTPAVVEQSPIETRAAAYLAVQQEFEDRLQLPGT